MDLRFRKKKKKKKKKKENHLAATAGLQGAGRRSTLAWGRDLFPLPAEDRPRGRTISLTVYLLKGRNGPACRLLVGSGRRVGVLFVFTRGG